MSAYIPEDLVLEVLPCLPLKSLIRFRYVSKSWATLIGTPDYLSKSIINDCILVNPTHPFLFVKRARITTDGTFYSYSFLCYSTLAFASEIHQDLPTLQSPHDIEVVGSCNGLLCIFDYIETGNIFVWNPTTVEFMLLPRAWDVGTVFFGFDPIHDEFKVLRIRYMLVNHFNFPALNREVEVYSLSGRSWRNLVVNIEVPDLRENDSAYTSSVCFWLALNCTGGKKVIAFDVCDEVFRTTALPNATLVESYCENWMSLMVLKESVALLVFPPEEVEEERFLDIWVLLEFGVKESWIRLVRIVPICCFGWPSGFWKKGELFMESEGDLVLYDPLTQCVRNLQLDGEWFQVLPFTRS